MYTSRAFPRIFSINAYWTKQLVQISPHNSSKLIEFCNNLQYVSAFGRMPRLYSQLSNYIDIQYERTSLSLIQLPLVNVKKCAFIQFFAEKQINVPSNFRRSVSLHRAVSQKFVSKFINLMQRNGCRKTAFKTFATAIHILSAEIFEYVQAQASKTYDWLFLLYSIVTTESKRKMLFNFPIEQFSKYIDSTNFSLQGKTFQIYTTMQYALQNRFNLVQPLFQFKFAKTDKRLRKFSRGKIGKYQCVVQYVPKFRRDSVLMHWLINEINFDLQEQWIDRIVTVLSDFLQNTSSATFKLNHRMLRIIYMQRRHRITKLGHYRIRYK